MSLQVTFGVSTWLWTSPFRTEQARDLFAKISDMGYDLVEIAVEDPGLINTAVIKEELSRNNLQVVVCGAFGPGRDLTSDDTARQKEGLQYIEDCLNITRQLGGRFFAGPMYSAVGKARMVSQEQRQTEWERAVQNLRKVCNMASDQGLELALEPLNRFESDIINNVQDILRLIEDIGHPAARIGLDGFHMNIEEPDVEQAITAAGNKLIHLQVSENYRGAPGSGQTNWQAYMKGLKKINYQGAISIESFTPDNKELAGAVCIWRKLAPDQDTFAKEGLAFLRQWADDGGTENIH